MQHCNLQVSIFSTVGKFRSISISISSVRLFQLCSFGFFGELQAVALTIAVPEQFFLPGRLRLTVAIFSAAFSPFWAALSVLQVSFLGSVRRCRAAPLPLSCTKETASNDTEQATGNQLNKHFC